MDTNQADEAGEHVQGSIYAAFQSSHPDGPDWMNPDFDCLQQYPDEIRMIAAFNELEYNMSNGGWAQVLWNCFGNWRTLLDIAERGYLRIGAAEQSAAICLLRRECERDEAECLTMLEAEDGSMENFGKFTSRSYGKGFDWERLFWAPDLYARRLRWLAGNQDEVMRLLGQSDSIAG